VHVLTFLQKLRCLKNYDTTEKIRGEGVEAVQIFCRQGGVIFFDFMRTSFMDGP